MEISSEMRAAIMHAYHNAEIKFDSCTETDWWPEKQSTTSWRIGTPAIDIAIEKCQLLLTPLSKISDEHIDELWKLLGLNPDYDKFEEYNPNCRPKKVYIVEFFTRPDKFKQLERFDYQQTRTIIDYLRSKGYDCGYGEIPSLIDAGIAIDKTKNTENEE